MFGDVTQHEKEGNTLQVDDVQTHFFPDIPALLQDKCVGRRTEQFCCLS